MGLAGDAFDAQIVRRLVSPALGSKSTFRSMDKLLPLPAWPYSGLERWHHLSFLKTSEVIEQLERIKAQALEPEMIGYLIHLIKYDLGYQLHQSVQKLKTELSSWNSAEFEFHDGDLVIRSTVDRASFEEWISEELDQSSRMAGASWFTAARRSSPPCAGSSSSSSAPPGSGPATSSHRWRWDWRGKPASSFHPFITHASGISSARPVAWLWRSNRVSSHPLEH